MTSKKSLDYMYNVAISNSGDFEKADRVRECYNIIADDLEVLELFKKYASNERWETRKIECCAGNILVLNDYQGRVLIYLNNDDDFNKIRSWLYD